MTNPVIIIGMHRSGTSLVTALLRRLGLFTGAVIDPNEESVFFQHINEWLFELYGASWSYPEPWAEVSASPGLDDELESLIRARIKGFRAARYLGYSRYFRYRRLEACPFSWGWKDPRSTFTLRFWLRVFPQAKVLHVYRHGVDVAASLVHRSTAALERHTARRSKRWNLVCLQSELPRVVDSARCLSLQGAFDLWERYVMEARCQIQDLPDHQCMEIGYEDILAGFPESMEKLVHFTGLDVSAALIRDMAGEIRVDRALAFQGDQGLSAFMRQVGGSEALACYGYHPDRTDRR